MPIIQQLLVKDHKKPLELFQLALMFETAEKELLKLANAGLTSDGTTVRATINGRNFKQRSGSQTEETALPNLT